MVAILLVALGIPLGLVLGGLAAGLWSRRSSRRSPAVFAVEVRAADVEASRWWRRADDACWAHDVLAVHRGLALVRSHVLAVAGASELELASSVRVLGDHPVGVGLELDDGSLVDVDGSLVDVAAALPNADTLIGPTRDRLVELLA